MYQERKKKKYYFFKINYSRRVNDDFLATKQGKQGIFIKNNFIRNHFSTKVFCETNGALLGKVFHKGYSFFFFFFSHSFKFMNMIFGGFLCYLSKNKNTTLVYVFSGLVAYKERKNTAWF